MEENEETRMAEVYIRCPICRGGSDAVIEIEPHSDGNLWWVCVHYPDRHCGKIRKRELRKPWTRPQADLRPGGHLIDVRFQGRCLLTRRKRDRRHQAFIRDDPPRRYVRRLRDVPWRA